MSLACSDAELEGQYEYNVYPYPCGVPQGSTVTMYQGSVRFVDFSSVFGVDSLLTPSRLMVRLQILKMKMTLKIFLFLPISKLCPTTKTNQFRAFGRCPSSVNQCVKLPRYNCVE